MIRRLASLGIVFGVLLLLGMVLGTGFGTQEAASAAAIGGQPELSQSVQSEQQVPGGVRSQSTGNLSVAQYSFSMFSAYPGQPISITLLYQWSGSDAAPNVVVTEQLPPQISVSSTTPAYTSRSGDTLRWELGTLPEHGTVGMITIEGSIRADADPSSTLVARAQISGDVTDSDPEDDVAELEIALTDPKPNLFLWKFGLLEELQDGLFFEAEQNSDISFDIYYANFSMFPAAGAVLTDTLPAGVEYVSATPAPTSINGNQLIWQLGSLEGFHFGQIKIVARPVITGELTNRADLSAEGAEPETAEFQFRSVALTQPRVLKPAVRNATAEEPLIVDSQPLLRGLAKAGATVTLYAGPEMCFDDESIKNCGATPLASTTAAADRTWEIRPTTPLTTGQLHYLYLQAEKDGERSVPWFGYWQPLVITVSKELDDAIRNGWDLDNFVIQSGVQNIQPGALGGSSSTTPNEPLTISIRTKAPPTIMEPGSWDVHDLLLVDASGSERITDTVKVSRVEPVQEVMSTSGGSAPVQAQDHWSGIDLIYVHKGFGPGSKVEIWCRPVYYTDDGLPIVALTWVKCHEILIDPAGYVYDRDKAGRDIPWPEVPDPEYLIPNATVTATVRTGDNTFVRWPAEETGQVNPQVTDQQTPDGIQIRGYFAFYVPSGQYKLEVTAPGCLPFESPILTVVEAPVFYNVGMRCTASSAGQITYTVSVPAVILGQP